MKLNVTELREKATAVINRIGRKGTVIICAFMLVGFAVILNVILYPGDNGSAKSNLAVDLDQLHVNNTAGEGEADDAAPVYNYFEAMQLSRQQARDEAMEVLLSVAESTTAVEDMKNEALESIAQIAQDIENESNIETLILSKGFAQCIAVVNGDTASIIVKSEGLLPSEIAQISEIVYEEAGILPTNLKIIEKDV
jgi:stage III sporulation protein AH